MTPIRIESAWRGTSNCRTCAIRDIALFADLDEQDFSRVHGPIDDMAYGPGQVLYQEGGHAASLLTVRSGMIKLVRNTADGFQRVVRVLRPGDVAGLEALDGARYDHEAIALTDLQVCRIPVAIVRALDEESPRLHQKLTQKWHRALREADDWLAELNHGSARRRVAQLLLKMRHPGDMRLTSAFSREDMGSMLDLKQETVSREISALAREGLIEALDHSGRAYRINDSEALEDA